MRENMLIVAEMNPYEKFIDSCKSEVTKKEHTSGLQRFMKRYKISSSQSCNSSGRRSSGTRRFNNR